MKDQFSISKFTTHAFNILQFIGALCSIAGLVIILLNPKLLENKHLVLIVILSTFILITLVYIFDGFRLRIENAKLNIQNEHQEKVREAYSRMSLGFARINQAMRSKQEASINERKQNLKAFLNELSSAYTLLTGKECATAIQVPISNHSEDVYIKTICRDSIVRGRNYKKRGENKQDIKNNSSFFYIFENLDNPKGRYFFENNLPIRKGYKNPSFELYSNFKMIGLPDDWSDEDRRKAWKLPFKSILVVPILPHPDIDEVNPDFKGFLTVDSKEENTFNENTDVEFLVEVSDCLYNYIEELLVKMNSTNLEKDDQVKKENSVA